VKWFDYAAPENLGAAFQLMAAHPRALLLAGGTDLLVQLRSGRKTTDLVIDVKRIPELNTAAYDAEGGYTLGAAVPCYRLYGHPALGDVAALIGGTQIQGRASIGGNLCNASPSADSVPLLIALWAICRIAGSGGAREVAVEDFKLRPGELLVSIYLPPPQAQSGAHYLRFIPRNEMDIAVVGAGVSVTLEDGHFRSARVALAAVAPTPLFVREAGDALTGQAVTPDNIARAAELARAAARPITDMRGTADYRRHLCGVLTRRALEAAVAKARGKQ
jgi:CO/xanthine dehydrogenase FAD-binding subunit